MLEFEYTDTINAYYLCCKLDNILLLVFLERSLEGIWLEDTAC